MSVTASIITDIITQVICYLCDTLTKGLDNCSAIQNIYHNFAEQD